MAELRAHRLTAATPAPPASPQTLRAHRLTAAGGTPVGPALRVHRITGAGTQAAGRTLRVYRAAAIGPRALRILPVPSPSPAGPGALVRLTAELEGGSPEGTRWSWRRVSGPTLAQGDLTSDGPSCAVLIPSVMPNTADLTAPVILTIGVTASANDAVSPEALVTIAVLPQTRWAYNGKTWVGSRRYLYETGTWR